MTVDQLWAGLQFGVGVVICYVGIAIATQLLIKLLGLDDE